MPPKKTQSQSQRQNVIVNIHQNKPATRKRKRKSKPKPTANPFYPERIIIPQLQVKQQAPLDYNKLIDIIQSAQNTRASSTITPRPSNPIQRQSSSNMGVQTEASLIGQPVIAEREQPPADEFTRPMFGETVEKGDGGGGNPLNFDPFQQKQADEFFEKPEPFQQKQADQFFEKPEPLSKAPSSKTADESSEEEEEVSLLPSSSLTASISDVSSAPTLSGFSGETPAVYNLNDYKKHISSKYPNVADDIVAETTLDAVRKKLREKMTPTQYENDVLRVSRMARKGKPKETATDFYTAFRKIGT